MESRIKKNKFFKLSEPQRMIFLSDKLYPSTSINTICVTSNLGTKINLCFIKLAINLVIKENPGLNIRVKSLEGIPYQYLEPIQDYEIEIIDFNRIGGQKYEDEWLEAEVNRVFNLDGSSLFKISLYYSKDGNLYLLISTHHIISDAWSHQNLTEQINIKYNQLLKNETPVYSQKFSYLDYIKTEMNYLISDRVNKSRDYWYSKFLKLQSLPKPIKKLKRTTSSEAKRHRNYFNKNIQSKILKICNEENIPFSSFFLSCLLITLHKLNSVNEFLIGTLTYNRLGKKEKEGVGMFVNTLPLLFVLKEELSFMEIVKLVELEITGLMRNQRFPLSSLTNDPELKELNIAGNLDIMYSYQNVILPYDYEFHFCRHSSYPILFRPTRVGETGDFYIDIDYQVNSFSSEEIHNISTMFSEVIENLNRSSICETSILTRIDEKKNCNKKMLCVQENKYNLNQTVHSLFESKVLEYRDKKAVSFQGIYLTYWELNRRANFLAQKLLALGAGNESPIVLLLNRSIEMIISILAVLKTGSCYLPLSIEQPISRTKKIIELSGTKIVIYNMNLVEDDLGLCTFIDTRSITYPQGDFNNIDIQIKPTNLAYIIYTSGSSGEPKGVMIEHRSVLNRLFWMQDKYPLNDSDVVLQKTPYTFDVSVWEFFGWFVSGSSLHFLIPGGEKEPITIVEEIYKEKVTIIHFVPSMLTLFLEFMANFGSMDHIKTLRRVSCSGESLLKLHCEKFYSLFDSSIELFNLYGPTEATIEVTSYDCINCDTPFVPIGKPIDNVGIYILDSNGKIVTPGILGELHIGGVCLARGYFKRDDLTSKKFRIHETVNKRLYSTGDLAMYLEDGNIRYYGRLDNQVKIRGNRVELGEIEMCLSKFPGIVESAVIAPIDNSGNAYLGAYYVSKEHIDHNEIMLFLKDKLPSYMIPSYFLPLSEFPLTSNGKLDRKNLSIPKRSAFKKSYYAPVNDREEEICEAWEMVLKVDNISRVDNFFDLGGDSLMLIKVHFILQDKYQITLQDLFEFQTIETLAQHIKLKIGLSIS